MGRTFMIHVCVPSLRTTPSTGAQGAWDYRGYVLAGLVKDTSNKSSTGPVRPCRHAPYTADNVSKGKIIRRPHRKPPSHHSSSLMRSWDCTLVFLMLHSPDCTLRSRNLEIGKQFPEYGSFPDSENAQHNLKIAQILRLNNISISIFRTIEDND